MHQKPDADAMGSVLGLYHYLKKLGHSVTVVSPTNWANWLNWMPGVAEVLNYDREKEKVRPLLSAADYLFCLDFNVFHRTKNFAADLYEATCIKVLIDHHQEPDARSFDFGISNVNKSSTCEMVYDFIKDAGHEAMLDIDISTCLYAGVVADTGSFRFQATTPAVHRMAARLMEQGIRHTEIHSQLFDNFLENRLRFMGNAFLHRLEFFYEYNAALIAIPKYDLLKYEIKTGDTEGLVNFPLSVQGIKLAALVIDRDEERKWSFRSKDTFDCNSFARKYFNGGGHFNASGGGTKESLQETILQFKTALKENEQLLQ
ncbi:exopolyphosphatase [Niabella ginsenosidivorans]|uniref:Exopolyphosphatase n=1 Tax=Niabella ginsenosidivorans TaxID=1176587 RepID=A0A1A9I165_9BACT|nr:DHH family phosphoesterase [Niabella ginsenosidivorans]ANH81366.1 exopolyphosphatase [Niabella ginsenosidivorans]